MADAALSILSATPTAPVTTPADGAPATALPADPFSRLLASVTPLKTPATTTLLALAHGNALPPATIAVDEIAQAEIVAPAQAPEADKKSADDAPAKGGGDPLAQAIASGATAVLALAPVIVAPTPAPAAPTRAATSTPLQAATTHAAVAKPEAEPATPAAIIATAIPTSDRAPPTAQAPTAAAISTNLTASTAPAPVSASETPSAPSSAPAKAVAVPVDMVLQMPADAGTTAPAANRPAAAQDQSAAATAPTTQPVRVATPQSPAGDPVAIAQAPSLPEVAETAAPILPQAKPPATRITAVAPPTARPAEPHAVPAQMPVAARGEKDDAPRRVEDGRRPAGTASTDPASFAPGQRTADPVRNLPASAGTSAPPKGDAVVQQTLSIARDGAWLDSLARDIVNTAGSGNDLHFRLEPQHLGALTVAITQSADGASIRMTTDTATTRDMLRDAQPQLVAEARAQGLKVSDTHVDLGQRSQDTNQDSSRWGQNNAGPQNGAHNGQQRQSSPAHQPFVSNLGRRAEAETDSPERDSDALYA